MARNTEQGLSGTIGNLVFYTMNGKNYVRSKPGKQNKKRNQKPNPLNTIFGTVSAYGSPMISRLSKVLLFPFGLSTYNQLRGWMRNQYAAHAQDINWELSVQGSSICKISSNIDLRDFLTIPLTVNDSGNGLITVSIPAINPVKDIKAPARTQLINLKLVAVTSTFGQTQGSNSFCMEQYNFNCNNQLLAAKEIVLNTGATAGSIVIVVAAIEYALFGSLNNNYTTNPNWLPAAIIAMGRMK